MSTAVAIEISVDVLVAAVLSELNDIITFEKEQIASPEVFSWVEKTRCGAKALQWSGGGKILLLTQPPGLLLTHSTRNEKHLIGPFHLLWSHFSNCFPLAHPLDGYAK